MEILKFTKSSFLLIVGEAAGRVVRGEVAKLLIKSSWKITSSAVANYPPIDWMIFSQQRHQVIVSD